LRSVDDEQRSLARLERARNLVREVDVAGRVDQVQLVALPLDSNGLRLDRDPALAFEVHRIEDLFSHLALRDGVRQLEDAVGERRLAVVDVRDDREVADSVLKHLRRRLRCRLQRAWALPTPPSELTSRHDQTHDIKRSEMRAGSALATLATCRARARAVLGSRRGTHP